MSWLNLEAYTPLELALCGIGCGLWVAVYAVVVWHMFRKRYVEIPAAAVAANVAWEFVWGVLRVPDLGLLFAWMYRAGFALDLVIVAVLWRHGPKQVSTPALRRLFHPALLFGIVAWIAAVQLFVSGGRDGPYGAVSGYLVNVQLSALYIVLFAKEPNTAYFSWLVAWAKLLGTGFISAFNVLAAGDDAFLMSLCAVTLVLDAAYVVLFARRRRAERAAQSAPGRSSKPS